MASFSIDDSELRALAADMTQAGPKVSDDVGRVVKKGATNIKKDLVAQARSSTHFRGFAPGISYDMESDTEAAIGPEKGAPGSLANIAYFGTSRGGGTVEEPGEALHREAPAFERELGKLAERSLD